MEVTQVIVKQINRTISVFIDNDRKMFLCMECHGSGDSLQASDFETNCSVCNGFGEFTLNEVILQKRCEKCQGDGADQNDYIPDDYPFSEPCSYCDGKGYILEKDI